MNLLAQVQASISRVKLQKKTEKTARRSLNEIQPHAVCPTPAMHVRNIPVEVHHEAPKGLFTDSFAFVRFAPSLSDLA
jgi:hypothetical protein